MSLITRRQYLDFAGADDERATMHQAYYAQFVNNGVRAYVAGCFSPEELVRAHREDRHLNTIPLERWDDAARACYPWFDQDLMRELGQIGGLATHVCIVKAAANILISSYLARSAA